MIKKKVVVDFARRKLYNINNHEILKLKFFRGNPFLIDEDYKVKYVENFDNYHKNCFRTRIKNRCILTGRSRAVFRIARLNRISFKREIEKGKLVGFKKSSW